MKFFISLQRFYKALNSLKYVQNVNGGEDL